MLVCGTKQTVSFPVDGQVWFAYSVYIAATNYIMVNPVLRQEPTDLFEVYTTNADQEQLVIKHQGFSRDIAETIMVKLFTIGGFADDLMLYNRTKSEVVCETLTNATLQQRGWCQA
jgi:hypothetical protein